MKSYSYLHPDPDGPVKGFLLVKGKQKAQRFSVRHRAVKITLIDEFSAMINDFDPLLLEIKGFAARRNEIAHGMVSEAPKGIFFLRPVDYNPRKNHMSDGIRTLFERATYHYTAADIQFYRENFEALARKILQYIEQVLKVDRHDNARDRENKEKKTSTQRRT